MKYLQRISLSIAFIIVLAFGAYNYFARARLIPKQIQSQLLSSIVEKEQILKIPSLKGNLSSPSIVARDDGYLLSLLVQVKEHYQSKNWKSAEKLEKYYIALTKLGDNLRPSHPYQLLMPKDGAGIPLFNLTHVNLISYNDQTWLFCSDQPSANRVNIYAYPVDEHGDKFRLGKPKLMGCHQYADSKATWSPIVFDNHLYLFSDTLPISCVEADLVSGKCSLVSKTDIDQIWPFGTIQSHCPMIQTSLGTVGFFHSTIEVPRLTNKGKTFPVNLISAWSPSLDKTFEIKSMLKAPITTSKMYSLFTNQKKIIEPTGITEKNGYLIVSSLFGDRISIIKIKTSDLFAIMCHN